MYLAYPDLLVQYFIYQNFYSFATRYHNLENFFLCRREFLCTL